MNSHWRLAIVKITPVLLIIMAAQAFVPQVARLPSVAQLQSASSGDPLGHLDGVGVPGSLSWAGDGQRLTNPSFETGLAPWFQSQSNTANGSAIRLASPGYQDATSAQLSVYSGNSSALSLASDSTTGITDLSQQKIAFNSATRLRLAVQVQAITGNAGSDMVEASLTLTTSTGNIRTLHYMITEGTSSPSPPSNSTTDGYLKISGYGTIGQWITIDRNLPSDTAAIFSDAASLNSVQSMTLKVHAQSLPGPHVVDGHIKYWDSPGFGHPWAFGEPVVYDTDNNGVYDSGETVIGCGYPNSCSFAVPPPGTALSTDPKFKFVDVNHNGIWDCPATTSSVCTSGEPVVYDNDIGFASGDGVYDYGEPLINCSFTNPTCTPSLPPLPGTLLMKVVQGHTQALFDQVELYSATGGYDWVKNGGFDAGLTNWYTAGFTSATSPVHSGSRSVQASVTGGAAEMDQSIDARPQVNSTMTFSASVNVATMAGTSTSDSVDIWLALDDSQGNSLSVYYYFDTGTGTIPSNRTDTVYLKANGFGTIGQWLDINEGLLQRVQAAVQSNALPYTAPYTVELVVLEARASSSRTTTAYFDDISLGTPARTGPAASYFYAADGFNTTYVYTAPSIPQGAFSVDVPAGRSILNITSPEGSALHLGDYTTSVSSGVIQITVPDSTSFKHTPVGDWKFFTSSTSGVSSVYAEDPTSHMPTPSVNLNSTVNFVSQSKDPFNLPIQNVRVNLTLWNANSVEVGPGWAGLTNSQGWFNVSSITLPLACTPPGIYKLQAAVSSILYPGVRTFQIAVGVKSPTLTITPASGAPGTQVQLQGSGFPQSPNGNSSTVQITFDDLLVGFAASDNGNFTFTFTIPQAQVGTHTVKAFQSTTGASATTSFQVTPHPLHDVAVVAVQASPRSVVSGQPVSIYVSLANYGNSSEIVDLTAYYGSHVAGTLSGIDLSNDQTLIIQWDTSGVSAGNYIMSATVFLSTDQVPSNNNLSDGVVTVLPPPTLVTTPTSGPVGTQVHLRGSGFPVPLYGPSLNQILVSFDDQFVGFTTSDNGQFSFIFNIPLAQAGMHTIKAVDTLTNVRATISFQVTSSPAQAKVEVAVTEGTIYFPGDTAVVTVQTTLNGQPVSVANLQIILIRPNGSNVTLNPVMVGLGEWKATFAVPTTGSIGTYAVIVKAQQPGLVDGSAFSGFEVKPTWLQSHSSRIMGAIAVLGAVGVLAVIWKKGYLPRRKDEFAGP